MQKTKPLRYALVVLLFALTLTGIALHSYWMLATLMPLGIILAIVGDVLENRPLRPYQQYNQFHDRHGHGDAKS